MALPGAVTTTTLTCGTSFAASGALVNVEMSVRPDFGGVSEIIWQATGQALGDFIEVYPTTDGTSASAIVPNPSQTGWVDPSGAAIRNWSYTVKITRTYEDGNGKRQQRTITKTVTPTSGQTTIDVDAVPSGTPTTPTVGATQYEPLGAVDAAIAEHEAAADPHPQYTTAAELAAATPAASTAVSGIVELATTSETTTGTDTARAVTPAGVKAATDALDVPSRLGLIPVLATDTSLARATAAAVAAGGGTLFVPPDVSVNITSATDLPDEVLGLRVDGEIVITADVSLATRTGSASGTNYSISAPINAGERTLSMSAGTTGLAVGDTVFIACVDTLPNATDKLGYLRVIRSLTGTSITVDAPIPRTMTTTRRLQKITLRDAFQVTGAGNIRYSSQEFTSRMFDFTFCRDVWFRGVQLRDGGDRAVYLGHVLGFDIDCIIDNFRDDLANSHVGYGVDIAGNSRNGRVRGTISRCRHAVTTNVGPDLTQFSFYGEPESCDIAPNTYQCSNKALDSHRGGWDMAYTVQDMGSGGAIQVRADNVTVKSIVASGYITGNPALTVDTDVTVPPTIGPARVSNADTAFYLRSDAVFLSDPEIVNVATAWDVSGAKAYLPGRPIMPTGSWIAPDVSAVATGSHTVNQLQLQPIVIKAGVSIASIATEVTTAATAGGLVRLGIYKSGHLGGPGGLLSECGTVDSTTTGVKTIALGSALYLRPGVYYLAAMPEVAQPSMRRGVLLGGSAATAANAIANTGFGYLASGVTPGSLPATLPTLSFVNNPTRVALGLS